MQKRLSRQRALLKAWCLLLSEHITKALHLSDREAVDLTPALLKHLKQRGVRQREEARGQLLTCAELPPHHAELNRLHKSPQRLVGEGSTAGVPWGGERLAPP